MVQRSASAIEVSGILRDEMSDAQLAAAVRPYIEILNRALSQHRLERDRWALIREMHPPGTVGG